MNLLFRESIVPLIAYPDEDGVENLPQIFFVAYWPLKENVLYEGALHARRRHEKYHQETTIDPHVFDVSTNETDLGNKTGETLEG